jgi:hypothetical protein
MDDCIRLAERERERVRAAIRARHPEYSDDELNFAFYRQWLRDDALFRQAWPRAPLLDP